MNMTIDRIQQDIVEEFSDVEDWMDRYAMIIAGCERRVWLNAELTPEGTVHFTADSDAIIVKGIISLLIQVLDNQTPDDILASNLHFIDDIGLSEHLSPTRSNGLLAMVKQMRLYALAFQAKQRMG